MHNHNEYPSVNKYCYVALVIKLYKYRKCNISVATWELLLCYALGLKVCISEKALVHVTAITYIFIYHKLLL